ncbi:unnamed protein product, partial [Polarella glacialis]
MSPALEPRPPGPAGTLRPLASPLRSIGRLGLSGRDFHPVEVTPWSCPQGLAALAEGLGGSTGSRLGSDRSRRVPQRLPPSGGPVLVAAGVAAAVALAAGSPGTPGGERRRRRGLRRHCALLPRDECQLVPVAAPASAWRRCCRPASSLVRGWSASASCDAEHSTASWAGAGRYQLGLSASLAAASEYERRLPSVLRAAEANLPGTAESRTDTLMASAFLLSAASNKVLLRLLLVLVMPYTYFLGAATSLMYMIVFGLQLKVSAALAPRGGASAAAMTASARFASSGPGLRLLGGSGLCEAASFVMLPFFASRLPGSLMPVMSQGLLIFSMIFSALLLGRRYNSHQVLGVGVVVVG